MLIELTKKQIESAFNEYIDECMDTETFGKFIQKLIRRYDRWEGSNTKELLRKFVDNRKFTREEKSQNGLFDEDV